MTRLLDLVARLFGRPRLTLAHPERLAAGMVATNLPVIRRKPLTFIRS